MEGGYLMSAGEKRISFRSVRFQNLVQNSCNVGLIMHLQVDLHSNLVSERKIGA
jgi:hypothetical protein